MDVHVHLFIPYPTYPCESPVGTLLDSATEPRHYWMVDWPWLENLPYRPVMQHTSEESGNMMVIAVIVINLLNGASGVSLRIGLVN